MINYFHFWLFYTKWTMTIIFSGVLLLWCKLFKNYSIFFKGSQFFSFELKGFIVIFQHKTLTTFQIRLLTRNSEHFAVFCSFFEFFLFIKFWVLHFLDFSSEINRIKISIIHSGPEGSVYLSNSRFFPSNPWFPLFFPLNSRNYFIVR